VKCPECGAPGAVELKPGAYVCQHCDNVFKSVDPGRITVDVRPLFCVCGNPVQFQCQVCEKAMCGVCDQGRHRNSREIIPVVGFGYRIRPRQHPADIILYFADIFGQIQRSIRDELQHLCYPCVVAAVPATAQAIADGVLCERPDCGAAASARCRCCKAAFCDAHNWTIITGRRPWSGKILYGFDKSVEYEASIPQRLCGMCFNERTDQAEREVRSILDAHEADGYAVTTRMMRKTRLQRIEDERVQRVAEQCAAVILARLNALGELPGECKRDGFSMGVTFFGDNMTYQVVDERHLTAPAISKSASDYG
jgi:hypothetical protein